MAASVAYGRTQGGRAEAVTPILLPLNTLKSDMIIDGKTDIEKYKVACTRLKTNERTRYKTHHGIRFSVRIELHLFLQSNSDLCQTVFDVVGKALDMKEVETVSPHEIVRL